MSLTNIADPEVKVAKALQELRSGTVSERAFYEDITEDDLLTLAQLLERTRDLIKLTLLQSSIGDDAAAALADGLAKNQSLRELTIADSNLTEEGTLVLANALKANRSLIMLSLGQSHIGRLGAQTLAPILIENETLIMLNLGNNEIGDDGAKALAEALPSSKLLQSLELANNGIGPEGAEALAVSLIENENLNFLGLSWNHIGDRGAQALAQPLLTSDSLTTLYLVKNGIGDDGAEALGKALELNNSVVYLYLLENNIRDLGAAALAKALEKNEMLKRLELALNDIGPDGAAALAEALKKNESLTSLALSRNHIGDEGATALAAGLSVNQTLASLYLVKNAISSTGAKALAESLETNKALTRLSLDWNYVGSEGAKSLAVALHTNQTLRWLDLFHCPIGKPGVNALADVVHADNVGLWKLSLDSKDEMLSIQEILRISSKTDIVRQQVKEYGERALAALQGDVKVRWGRAKVMVVGKVGVGKSALIRALLHEPEIQDAGDTAAPPGIQIKLTRSRNWTSQQRIDTADLGKVFAQQQTTRKSLLRTASKRVSQRLSQIAGSSQRRRPLVNIWPSKLEKTYDAKSMFEAKQRAKAGGGARGSRLTDEDISFSFWNFSGPEVLQDLFCTPDGIYILVFDLRELAGKENFPGIDDNLDNPGQARSSLSAWLRKIKVYAPSAQVLLVGTHYDAVNTHEMLQAIDVDVATIFDESGGNLRLLENARDDLHFFLFDKTDEHDLQGRLQDLRNLLTSIVVDSDFLMQKFPLRWLWCLDQLFMPPGKHTTYNKVLSLAHKKCGLNEDTDVPELLSFMQRRGVLVHLTCTGPLRNLVMTHPQWVITNLSRIVCARQHMGGIADELLQEYPGLEGDLTDWSSQGLVSQNLLAAFVKRQHAPFFSELMQELLLACASPWSMGDECMLVPSLLPPISLSKLQDILETDFGMEEAVAHIQMSLFSEGLFERCIARVLQDMHTIEDVLGIHANLLYLQVENIGPFLIRADPENCCIVMHSHLGKPADSANDFVLNCVTHIDQAFMNNTLQPTMNDDT